MKPVQCPHLVIFKNNKGVSTSTSINAPTLSPFSTSKGQQREGKEANSPTRSNHGHGIQDGEQHWYSFSILLLYFMVFVSVSADLCSK